MIQQHVKTPLAEEVLFGRLAKGGMVLVDVEDGKPVFSYSDDAPPAKKKGGAKAAGKPQGKAGKPSGKAPGKPSGKPSGKAGKTPGKPSGKAGKTPETVDQV